MSLSSTILLGFGFGGIGPMEMVIVGIVAVLLFGKRLPEVGRSLGKGLVEFKKGIRGIEDDLNTSRYGAAIGIIAGNAYIVGGHDGTNTLGSIERTP